MKTLQPIFSIERYENAAEKDFYRKKRQIFILTESGKPVYSRYGNEVNLGNIMATFSVIINKMMNHRGNGRENKLHCIHTNVNRTFFQHKNCLFFIVVTSKKSDTIFQLQKVLETLAFQIDFSITTLYKKHLGKNYIYKINRG